MNDSDGVVQTTSPKVSVGDDSLDQLVEANSRPSIPDLAGLIKKGKDQGLIKAQQDYAWQAGQAGSNPAGSTTTASP